MALPDQLGEGANLGAIAQGNARTVGLDQLESRGVNATGFVGPLKGQHLPLGAGGQQPQRLPVAGGACPLEQRIDAIAIGFGIHQSLENHHAYPLAEQRALGPRMKGFDRIASQRPQLAENHIDLRRCRGMHPARQHHVAATAAEFLHGVLDGDQR
nr:MULTISPECIES: hypothetical protein [unclassified Synechococcus]